MDKASHLPIASSSSIDLNIVVDDIPLKRYPYATNSSKFYILARPGTVYGLGFDNRSDYFVKCEPKIDGQQLPENQLINPNTSHVVTVMGEGRNAIQLQFAVPRRTITV